jgi:pimeloyl-ACP methyl ester carboxylesterase
VSQAFTDVRTSDGRTLRYEITGAPAGSPVFLLHGTPGSRIGPKPRSSVLYRLGVRLISYDRPGYGGSDRHEKRRVADAATDIETIADHLGLDRFSVVGRSGGGPHALAAAALLPARVARAAALVSVAPVDAEEIDWFGGMNDENSRAFHTAEEDEPKLVESLRLRADQGRRDPTGMLEVLRRQMTEADLRVVHDWMIRKLLAETYSEALSPGPYGWIDDVLAFRRSWGFRLADIRQPVRFWHGAQDNFAPVSHTRWLADRVPHAEVEVQSASAHFGAMEILPAMLSWLGASSPALAHTA